MTGEDRFSSLHLHARQRQIRVEGMRELEAAYERQHLFKPKITKKAEALERWVGVRAETRQALSWPWLLAKLKDLSTHLRPFPQPHRAKERARQERERRDRFEKLYRDAEIRKVHRALLEREILKQKCSFQPQLSAGSPGRSPARPPGSTGSRAAAAARSSSRYMHVRLRG